MAQVQEKTKQVNRHVMIRDKALDFRYRMVRKKDVISKLPPGRPRGIGINGSLCSDSIKAKATEMARVGCAGYLIAASIGVSVVTFTRWFQQNTDFRLSILQGWGEHYSYLLEMMYQLMTGRAKTNYNAEFHGKILESSINRLDRRIFNVVGNVLT